MTQIVLCTELDASPSEAFEFLTDFAYASEWSDSIKLAELRGGGDAPSVGDVVHEVRQLPALLGGRHDVEATLTHVEPGRRLTGRVLDHGVQISFAYQFDQVRRDTTRVTLRCTIVPTRAGRGLLARIASSVLERQESRRLGRMGAGLIAWRRAGRSAA